MMGVSPQRVSQVVDAPGGPQAGNPARGSGRTAGPHRPGPGDAGPPRPHLGDHGEGAVERRSPVPRRALPLDQRLRQAEPPAAAQPGAHRRRPRLPGRHVTTQAAHSWNGRSRSWTRPAGHPGYFRHRRRDARRQPRRLRRAEQRTALPGPSSWSGSAAQSGPPPCRLAWPPTCATTPPTGPPTTTASRPSRPGGPQRRHRPDPFPAAGQRGDAGPGRERPPVGLPPGRRGEAGTAGARLAHPGFDPGVAPGSNAPTR